MMKPMRSLMKTMGVVLLLLLSTVFLACSEEVPKEAARTASPEEALQKASPEEAKKIDLNVTREYVKDWAARTAFPESVSFAFYCSYALEALQKKIDPDTRKKITDYLKKCQTESGGFVPEPEFSKDPDLLSTYYALKTLSLLDETASIDQKKAVAFVLSLAQEDGSFKADPKKDYRSLATTYYGVASLHVLKALDQIDKAKTVSYIQSYREKNQGFCVEKNRISRPISTHMAIRALKLLDALDDAIKPELVAYLKGTRYAGHVEDEKYTTQPTLRELAFVLEALDDLSAVKEIDQGKVYAFIESLYIPENGGFGPKPSYGTTPPSIYEGIVSLQKLGKLN